MGNTVHMETKCHDVHNMSTLTLSSIILCGSFMICTIPINILFIFCIIGRGGKLLQKGLYYKLLLNIAVADLLTGLYVEPVSLFFLVKELRKEYNEEVIPVLKRSHVSLFFTDAVALTTMTILSIDRAFAILKPIKYHLGMKKSSKNAVVILVWPVAFLLVVSYFVVEYTLQLLIFSSLNIAVCILSLIGNIIIYKRQSSPFQYQINKTTKESKLTPIPNHYISTSDIQNNHGIVINNDKKSNEERETKHNLNSLDGETQADKSIENDIRDEKSTVVVQEQSQEKQYTSSDKKFPRQSKIQVKATRAFLNTLGVFVVIYLPTLITMIYINFCTTCNCEGYHIMRDISILSILMSSIIRPLNFILTLKPFRDSVKRMMVKARLKNICKNKDAVQHDCVSAIH